MTYFQSTALISVGSNQPYAKFDVGETVDAAIRRLTEGPWMIRAASPFYQTPAFPPGAGPDFVNAALSLETDLMPEAILAELAAIELAFGRQRQGRWRARTLDLDLLAVDALVRPDAKTQGLWRALPLDEQLQKTPQKLILPHPRLQDRAFVLVPLADVAPDWVHPLLGKTVREMLAAIPESEKQAVKALVKPDERS